MLRKQIYLKPMHDRKVKAIAALRGATESEVIREAVEKLPDPSGGVIERLEAAGLLVPKSPDPDPMTDEELDKLEAEVIAMFESLPPDKSLSNAIFDDREGR